MSSTEKKKAESYGRIVLQVFLTGLAYYLATEIAWALCFPNSKVSLLFPPHAVLVAILLLVPVRHWWAYTLATIVAHFVATQQAHWPVLYALHCEAFDAVQNVLAAAGIRFFIKSPLRRITLRDAMVFVLIAVIIVPFAQRSGARPLPSPTVSELITGSSGVTWESPTESPRSCWSRHFCWSPSVCRVAEVERRRRA